MRVYGTGREPHHLLGESGKLAALLEVSDIPCVVFTMELPGKPIAIWPIKHSWVDTSQARRLLGGELQRALPELVAVLKQDPTAHDLVAYVHQWLEGLTKRLDDLALAPAVPPAIPVTPSATIGESTVLVLNRETYEVSYKGHDVPMGPTQFRLLLALAGKPRQWVANTEMVRECSRRNGDFIDELKWAKNHKLLLMKALRGLVGIDEIAQKEVDSLITAKYHCLQITLASDQIAIQ